MCRSGQVYEMIYSENGCERERRYFDTPAPEDEEVRPRTFRSSANGTRRKFSCTLNLFTDADIRVSELLESGCSAISNIREQRQVTMWTAGSQVKAGAHGFASAGKLLHSAERTKRNILSKSASPKFKGFISIGFSVFRVLASSGAQSMVATRPLIYSRWTKCLCRSALPPSVA